MDHSFYMHRCLQLALLGAGQVAPNPMVGALLVHDNRIIGEGWHRKYGESHAEPNAINDAISRGYKALLSQSVLYVSLEPCAHHGKTPPCADLITRYRIPTVVVGCKDPFPQVDGKGIGKLEAAGIRVITGVLEKECLDLNRRFFTFHTLHRPYILLKWAQTADRFIASHDTGNRLLISHDLTNRLVHRWRSEEAAILVGTHTALYDDPALTTRLWEGPSPLRIVVDMDLRLPPVLKLFDQSVPTLVFNTLRNGSEGAVSYYQVTRDVSLVQQVIHALYRLNIQSVIVEGGARLLQSFLDENSWDEARVITSRTIVAGNGLPAPQPGKAVLKDMQHSGTDTIEIFNYPG